MSAVCQHFSAVCQHFSALLWTVCICPHLLSAVVCTVQKINSCQTIHTGSSANLITSKYCARSPGRRCIVPYGTIPLLFAWSGSRCCPHYCPHLSTFCLHVSTLCPQVKKIFLVGTVIACYYINKYVCTYLKNRSCMIQEV
jgi:hypothetical protein